MRPTIGIVKLHERGFDSSIEYERKNLYGRRDGMP